VDEVASIFLRRSERRGLIVLSLAPSAATVGGATEAMLDSNFDYNDFATKRVRSGRFRRLSKVETPIMDKGL
jgi:hypothetical protein